VALVPSSEIQRSDLDQQHTQVFNGHGGNGSKVAPVLPLPTR
jgi:hypothetical protein